MSQNIVDNFVSKIVSFMQCKRLILASNLSMHLLCYLKVDAADSIIVICLFTKLIIGYTLLFLLCSDVAREKVSVSPRLSRTYRDSACATCGEVMLEGLSGVSH